MAGLGKGHEIGLVVDGQQHRAIARRARGYEHAAGGIQHDHKIDFVGGCQGHGIIPGHRHVVVDGDGKGAVRRVAIAIAIGDSVGKIEGKGGAISVIEGVLQGESVFVSAGIEGNGKNIAHIVSRTGLGGQGGAVHCVGYIFALGLQTTRRRDPPGVKVRAPVLAALSEP